MAKIFIAHYNNKPYLLEGSFLFPLPDHYFVQATIIESSENSIGEIKVWNDDCNLIFITEAYDPIGKVKTGKFFKRIVNDSTRPYKSKRPNNFLTLEKGFDDHQIEVSKYESYEPSSDFKIPETEVIFGNEKIKTRWRILGFEPIAGREELFILQEYFGFGLFPNLKEESVPHKYLPELMNEYQTLRTDIKSSPGSIIDNCRDVAISALTAYLSDNLTSRIDLGELIKILPEDRILIKNLATIINRFHPRRKPNEVEKHNLPPLTFKEANLVLTVTLQLLVELDYAI